MKIAIIAPSMIGGGCIRAMAYKNFLQSKNHCVDLLSYDEIWQSRIILFYYKARARTHLFANGDFWLIKKIADALESKIKNGNYDVVIGVESWLSYVFTRDLRCLKIFSWESMADELYFNPRFKKDSQLELIHRAREMELEICMNSDYVVFPWETTENYVRKHVWDGSNFLTVRYGCYPQSKPVSFSFPPSIVSLGNLDGYWVNKELLSYLTSISPYLINTYGARAPERKYKLNYKGYASSLDVLYDHQFGLNTVSKDIFRRNHFSSRPLSYLAYGLPVLSPDWMQFSHELKGCLPYNEDNFVDLIDQYSERSLWEKLSKEAYSQGRELDWNTTLRPLEKIISK